ncbi:hypothetical protein OSC13_18840 [Serratia marcescens]|uniref:hypothetical protein n=1 Tax=Serratia marcescens TaxID=615 RepID=UPI00112BE634|nr:hypothetical protein [Serratia marcescens]MDS0779971.1 hypothetical protein [Serratia marcescens]TPV69947.1 hypothetical protein FJ699_05440 [Serratia marcescens]
MDKLSELSKPVAEVVSKFGDPEAFGEREIKLLTGIQQMAYGTKFYSQEYVSALLEEIGVRERSLISNCVDYEYDLIKMKRRAEAAEQRVAELEAIRANASQVFKEIGTQLGCNPDNESIMMAIDELKATQVTGPLALIIKRAEEMERILEGITPEMIAGGWTAKGISDYAKSLEAKLATPVRLKKVDSSNVPYAGDGFNAAVDYCADRVRAAGFTVQGDE